MFLFRQDETMFRGREVNGDVAPSTRMIEIRQRKREICNKIHNSTWLIETLGLSICLIFQLLALRIDHYVANSIANLIGKCASQLLGPFTLLFTEKRIKVIVLEQGWISAFKSAITFKYFTPIVPLRENPRPANAATIQQNANNFPNHCPIDDADSGVTENKTVPNIQLTKNRSEPKNSIFSSSTLPNVVHDDCS